MIRFQLENIDLIGDLVRSLTQLSTHCMVLSGSKALRSVSPSHPLRLAHTAVLPAACPVFKWATHKFWICFIGYKRGRKRAEHKLDFVDRKQKLLPYLYRCQAWQWCHRQRWSLCCWFLPQWVPGALRNRENDWEGFIPYSISISEQHSAYLKRSGGGYRLREPDPVAFTAVTVKHELALRWSRTKIHPQHARVAVEEPTNVHQSIFFLLTTTF